MREILCWVGCSWIVLGHPEDQWTGLDYGRYIGCPWIVHEHPEDHWTGLDCERVTVLGGMSVDSPRTSRGPVDWIGLWERYWMSMD